MRLSARATIACTLVAACLVGAPAYAVTAQPDLPSVPQLPSPPAVPQLPDVQPPSVQLPSPPSVPQTQLPRPPTSVPSPSLPGTGGGGGGGGGATPTAPGAPTGQSGGRAVPGSAGGAGRTSGAGAANGAAAAGPSDPAARRRRATRRLERSVTRLQGCLSAVDGLAREVLVLRSGLGDRPAASRRAVARRLDVSRRRVARAERTGLRSLRRAARASGCEGFPSPLAIFDSPWLEPLGAVLAGFPIAELASLRGNSGTGERDGGAVLGLTRGGTASGAEPPGSGEDGDKTGTQSKRVAAAAGGDSGVLLPLLVTLALFALVVGFAVLRDRRSESAAAPDIPLGMSAPPGAPPPEAKPAPAPWAIKDDGSQTADAPESEPAAGEPTRDASSRLKDLLRLARRSR